MSKKDKYVAIAAGILMLVALIGAAVYGLVIRQRQPDKSPPATAALSLSSWAATSAPEASPSPEKREPDEDPTPYLHRIVLPKRHTDKLDEPRILARAQAIKTDGRQFGNYSFQMRVAKKAINFTSADAVPTEGLTTEGQLMTDTGHIVTHKTISKTGPRYHDYKDASDCALLHCARMKLQDPTAMRAKINGREWMYATGYSDIPYYERPKQCVAVACTKTDDEAYHVIIVEGAQDDSSVSETLALANAAVTSFKKK